MTIYSRWLFDHKFSYFFIGIIAQKYISAKQLISQIPSLLNSIALELTEKYIIDFIPVTKIWLIECLINILLDY